MMERYGSAIVVVVIIITTGSLNHVGHSDTTKK